MVGDQATITCACLLLFFAGFPYTKRLPLRPSFSPSGWECFALSSTFRPLAHSTHTTPQSQRRFMPTTQQTTAAIHHDWHKFGVKANDITSCNKQ